MMIPHPYVLIDLNINNQDKALAEILDIVVDSHKTAMQWAVSANDFTKSRKFYHTIFCLSALKLHFIKNVVNESTITASTNVADGVDNEANMGAVVIR